MDQEGFGGYRFYIVKRIDGAITNMQCNNLTIVTIDLITSYTIE